MNRNLLTIAIALIALPGFSQTLADTSFIDATKQYKIKLPNLNEFLVESGSQAWSFEVAVIPIDSVGNKEIIWNDIPVNNASKPIHSSETILEKQMMTCLQGHEPSVNVQNAAAIPVKKKNYCMDNYCWISENTGYDMGKFYFTDYIGLEKLKHLIIFKFTSIKINCNQAYIEPGEHEAKLRCEADIRKNRIVNDAFINLVTSQLHFEKITVK